jgi:hypothetical protein
MRAITSGRKLSLYIYSERRIPGPERRIPGLSARFAVPVELAPVAGFASAVELVSTAEFAQVLSLQQVLTL